MSVYNSHNTKQWEELLNAINGGDTSAIATALGLIKTSIDSINTSLGSLSVEVEQDTTQWTNLINAIANQSLNVDLSNITSSVVNNLSGVSGSTATDALNTLNSTLSSKQDASTAINTSNIGSQHVSRSDEANSLQGHAPATGSIPNTVVVRDSGGYIWSEYFNCTNRSIQSMQDFTSYFAFFSSDGFLRKASIESARAALNISSSRLVKKNIVDMPEDEAKKILDLHVVNFDYINGKKNQCGLIAEEALNVIPYCVDIPKDYDEEKAKQQIAKSELSNIPSIDYSKLVAPLIKIVQMQQEQIDKLREQLNSLIYR